MGFNFTKTCEHQPKYPRKSQKILETFSLRMECSNKNIIIVVWKQDMRFLRTAYTYRPMIRTQIS